MLTSMMKAMTPVSRGWLTSSGPLPLAGKPPTGVVGVRAAGDTSENGVDVAPVGGGGVLVGGGVSVFVGVAPGGGVSVGMDGVEVGICGVEVGTCGVEVGGRGVEVGGFGVLVTPRGVPV